MQKQAKKVSRPVRFSLQLPLPKLSPVLSASQGVLQPGSLLGWPGGPQDKPSHQNHKTQVSNQVFHHGDPPSGRRLGGGAGQHCHQSTPQQAGQPEIKAANQSIRPTGPARVKNTILISL